MGGLTDVGRHTGGEARATGWPLARAVARFAFEQLDSPADDAAAQPADSLPVLEAEFLLYCAEAALAGRPESADAMEEGRDAQPPSDASVAAPSPPPATLLLPRGALSCEAAAAMVARAALAGAALADAGHDVASFAARAAAARAWLLRSEDAAAARATAAFVLPPLRLSPDGAAVDGQRPVLPSMDIPPQPPRGASGGNVDAARALAETNLGWLPLPPPTAQVGDITAWMAPARFASSPAQLRREGFEEWLFCAAVEALPADDNGSGLSSPGCAQMSASEIDSLHAALQAYRSGKDGGRMDVEARSREALAC